MKKKNQEKIAILLAVLEVVSVANFLGLGPTKEVGQISTREVEKHRKSLKSENNLTLKVRSNTKLTDLTDFSDSNEDDTRNLHPEINSSTSVASMYQINLNTGEWERYEETNSSSLIQKTEFDQKKWVG